MEDKLAEVELQREGLQELIATLKDGRGAEKVAKWQARMEAVALENVRHKREVERVKDQVIWSFNISVSLLSSVLLCCLLGCLCDSGFTFKLCYIDR